MLAKGTSSPSFYSQYLQSFNEGQSSLYRKEGNKMSNEQNKENEKVFSLLDEDNYMNCTECPYNEEFDDWQNRLPCGQWHCWVDVHCHPECYGRA